MAHIKRLAIRATCACPKGQAQWAHPVEGGSRMEELPEMASRRWASGWVDTEERHEQLCWAINFDYIICKLL